MSASKKPLIAVTGPSRKLTFGWWATQSILRLLGCRCCYVTADSPVLPEGVRGVVIGGGSDIEPLHYGLMHNPGVTYDPRRDKLEMAVIKAAIANDLPMLGICRGAQLINVVKGGTLHVDIRPMRQFTSNRYSALRIKDVELLPDSRLAKQLQVSSLRINSLHNQAINQIADSLNIIAKDRDGFVQAFECMEGSFILGTQWHPEYLTYRKHHRAIFKCFIRVVKQSSAEICLDKAIRDA
jgi:putative glutamine amidotransferase